MAEIAIAIAIGIGIGIGIAIAIAVAVGISIAIPVNRQPDSARIGPAEFLVDTDRIHSGQ